jgi:geranylgeranyl reductase family protein
MKYDAEVVVVGAGPAGSRVAQKLAAAGREVILLDRRCRLGDPVCCTGIISTQCLEQFDVDADLVLRRYYGASIHAPGGEVIDIRRREVQAVAIDRGAFDRRMAEKAVAAGTRLHMGTRVTGVKTGRDCAIVEFVRDGQPGALRSQAVVVAAGLTPKLTKSLGLGHIRDAALGFQLEVETPAPVNVEVFLGHNLAPGFFAWLAPLSDSRAKVGLIARRRADGNLERLVAAMRSQGRIGDSIGEISCRAIPLSILPRTAARRVLVVGDAAGQVKATTGGGLYYGLVCADLAAKTLEKALSTGDFSAGSLRNYERAWQRAIGRDMRIGRLARSVFQRLSDRRIDRILVRARDTGLIDRLAEDGALSFDWHGKTLLKAAGRLLPSLLI